MGSHALNLLQVPIGLLQVIPFGHVSVNEKDPRNVVVDRLVHTAHMLHTRSFCSQLTGQKSTAGLLHTSAPIRRNSSIRLLKAMISVGHTNVKSMGYLRHRHADGRDALLQMYGLASSMMC